MIESSYQNGIKLVSWNIDTNFKIETSPLKEAFPEWRSNLRSKYIIQKLDEVISSQSPDIINIQECRKFKEGGEEIDSLTPIVEFFKSKKMEVIVQPYLEDGSDKPFIYVTAYNPKTLEFKGKYNRYLTKTPEKMTDRSKTDAEIKDNNFGEFFERCVLINEFEHKEAGKIFDINTHLGISEFYRLKASELLVDFSKEILEKNLDAKIIMTGDFNTFADSKGKEQVEKIVSKQENGEKILKEIVPEFPKEQESNSTFIAFPYDFAANERRINAEFEKANNGLKLLKFLSDLPINERKKLIFKLFEKECQAYGSVLDHIFVHGFSRKRSKAEVHFAALNGNPKSMSEKDVKYHILNTDAPAFASDHQMLITELGFKDKYLQQKKGGLKASVAL